MPGSTGGEIRAALENASNRTVGEDLGLCYSPEFIALGSVVRDMLFPDMVLIGESDSRAGDLLQKIYQTLHEKHQRMNFVNAELTKLAVNTFVTTKISYANMLASICDVLPEADVEAITQAIGLDSRIGKKYLKAGPSFGGPCFPRDNFAFTALAERIGAHADIAEATQRINQHQHEQLLTYVKKYAGRGRIGILGLSYKPATYFVEKSAGLEVANRLSAEGYAISVYDPMALTEAKKYLDPHVGIASSLKECIRSCETIMIATAWPEFAKEIKPELLSGSNCSVIIDCWRQLSREAFADVCEVIHLGRANFCEQMAEI
jgi:UDPglucose 6-dehydrogenase